MRSTAFVVFSILFHGLAAMAIVMTPTQTVSSDGADRIEVKLGTASVHASQVSTDDSTSQKIIQDHSQIEVKKVSPTKTVVKIKRQHKAVEAAVALPKKMDPAVDDKDTAVAAVPAADNKVSSEDKTDKADDSAEAQDESVKFIPVKETADGVEPATQAAEQTEADSEDAEQTVDPAPVGVSTDDTAPAAAPAPTDDAAPAATSPAPAPTGDVGKGGATKDAALAYTDLKQAPGNQPPNYPMQARLDKRQGQVDFLYHVNEDGSVSDVQVVKSSGSKDLDTAAAAAIAKYHYVPGQVAWVRHPVSFRLKGPVATMPSELRGKGAQAD